MASIGYFNAFNWAIDATEVGSLVFGNTTVAQQNQNTLTLQSVLNSGGDLRITVRAPICLIQPMARLQYLAIPVFISGRVSS